MYDTIIIGAGAAGLTAAIYAARAGLHFLVLEQDGIGGGQILAAHRVQNYPGFPDSTGIDLGEAIRGHAVSLGAQIELGTVETVKQADKHYQIVLQNGNILETGTVIAATGASPRKLGVPGEKEFLGKGVSYCATCDGAFFKDKNALVVGGGDTAVEDALYLASICRHVTLIHRREEFRAAKTRADLLKEKPNISLRLNAEVGAIIGDGKVTGVTLKDGSVLPADGVFIAVGTVPETGYLQDLPLDLENGYVIAGEDCRTALPGIFAAGDIRKKPLRQVITAAADGANAVFSILDELT